MLRQRLRPADITMESLIKGSRKLKLVVEQKEESASLFKDYLSSFRKPMELDFIPTTHITVTDGERRVVLRKEQSVVEPPFQWRDHEYPQYTTIVYPHQWTGYNWEIALHQCCWLVTNAWERIPITSYNHKPFPFLKSKRAFAAINEIAHLYGLNTVGFALEPAGYDNNPGVGLYYQGRLLVDTTICPLWQLYTIYLGAKKGVLTEIFYTDRTGHLREIIGYLQRQFLRIEHRAAYSDEVAKTLEKQRKDCKEWGENFFDEVAANLENTKSVSRHRVFGDLRRFLENKRAEFQRIYS